MTTRGGIDAMTVLLFVIHKEMQEMFTPPVLFPAGPGDLARGENPHLK
jgi:hypothetical protein